MVVAAQIRLDNGNDQRGDKALVERHDRGDDDRDEGGRAGHHCQAGPAGVRKPRTRVVTRALT